MSFPAPTHQQARILWFSLTALATDPARRAAMGEASAVSARQRFSPAAMARRTTALYRGEPVEA